MSGGGPVSGAPILSAIDAIASLGGHISYTNSPDDAVRGIIVSTLLQISADAVSYWTNMTCLYNRYWYPLEDMITMPIAMFHVKRMTEHQRNETSRQRVMLYEPQNQGGGVNPADPLREGVMQTVVDNIVRQPKTYTVEALVPFQPVGRYVTGGVKVMSDMLISFAELLETGDGGRASVSSVLSAWTSSAAALMKGADQAMTLMSLFGFSGVDRATMINKNSLEAMADSGKALCMKMWTGYDYKFVVITDLTFDKDPMEDDVFRATMQLEEMPVLQVMPDPAMPIDTLSRGWRAQAISAVMGLLAKPLVWVTDVDTHAGGDPANMIRADW
jgi:hypothetical protein